MEIAYIHFYVADIQRSRNWFIETMGFSFLGQKSNAHTMTESVGINNVLFLISAALNETSPVAHYLEKHPPGVADIAFLVEDFNSVCQKLETLNIDILENNLINQKDFRLIKIKGWGSLKHTLIEKNQVNPSFHKNIKNNPINLLDSHFENNVLENRINSIPSLSSDKLNLTSKIQINPKSQITSIDHVVLNVERDQLKSAVAWYQKVFDFHVQQKFTITTTNSGLYSEALIDASNHIQFNINEPTSNNSQIQNFLDLNFGSGIQHIALRTHDIFQTVQQMKSLGLQFLFVPPNYYTKLDQKYHPKIQTFLTEEQWEQLKKEQILLDFPVKNPQSLLMQIFTQPIFEKPTFFFEFIERRENAQGFGEGNFLALFEAIESEQKGEKYPTVNIQS